MASVTLGPAQLDLLGIRAGDANQIAFNLTLQGNPVDLSGKTLTAQVRKNAIDPVASLNGDIQIVDATLGKFILSWNGDEVRTLLAGTKEFTGVWDLQVAPAAGLPTTYVAGVFKAVMDVTRP